jgi:hypothetical protein
MPRSRSHTDFDVVTGPSMPQRPVPLPQRPSRSAETATEPVALPPAPITDLRIDEGTRR